MNYVLLYRGSREWRITVGTSGEKACGALRQTGVSESFDAAAHEFAALLLSEWGVEKPFAWQEIRSDWWGADLTPGALAAAGEAPD